MELCGECKKAEVYANHAIYTPALCCRARSLAGTPRRLQRQAFDAVTAGLSPQDAHAVRVRAHELIAARKQREVEL